MLQPGLPQLAAAETPGKYSCLPTLRPPYPYPVSHQSL